MGKAKRRTGWRAWGLAQDAHGPVLRSPEFGKMLCSLTFPDREAWADCFDHDHDAPHPACGCGLYSAESVEAARVWLPPDTVAVAGKVELLGQVVEHSGEAINVAMTRLLPAISNATGRDTSSEYRSAGVRLRGAQALHPRYADEAAALTARYGVPFRVDQTLAGRVDASAELTAQANRLFALQASLRGGGDAAGLLLFNRARTHVVLQSRSGYVDHPHTWALIGGQVETGETPTDAAVREAWEEARLDPTAIEVDREVPTPGYTYVVATTDWTPGDDPVLPHSANLEADGAAWVPVAALDTPERFPRLPLHPLLEKAWPAVRGSLASPACV